MPNYNVYNKYGVKVGEIQPPPDNGFFILILASLGIAIAPLWAAYKMGRGTWRYHGLLTKLISGFFLVLWTVGALLVIGIRLVLGLNRVYTPNLAANVAGALGVLAILFVAYRIGKARS